MLASIWYEGLPGFRQMNMFLQTLEVCRIGLLFPFFSLAYIVFPCANFSLKLRKPFIKFICTSASYFTFLCKLFSFFHNFPNRFYLSTYNAKIIKKYLKIEYLNCKQNNKFFSKERKWVWVTTIFLYFNWLWQLSNIFLPKDIFRYFILTLLCIT